MPLANLVPPTLRLSSPKTVKTTDLARIQAFDQAICEKRALLARQRQRLLCKLLNCHWHMDTLNPRLSGARILPACNGAAFFS